MGQGCQGGKGTCMEMTYFLAFMDAPAQQQRIDPATCPVVIRRRMLFPPHDPPTPDWVATDESGLGSVVDSSSAGYSSNSLEELVTMLAGAGFKGVSIDMGTVPVQPHPSDSNDLPF